MNLSQLLISGWDWEPSVLIGCICLILAYFVWVRPMCAPRERTKKSIYFLSAVVILFLSLVSPLDTLADDYLFSAHMLQHLLLMLAVPPLMILGTPESSARRILRWSFAAKAEGALSRPAVAWIVGVGTLAIWHLPMLYNAALASEDIHIVQHLCFLVSATIFWWPLSAPITTLRLEPPNAIAYLFLAILANTLIAAIITFAPDVFYPAYLAPKDDLGLLPMIRQGWGISPHVDQQLGGLLMWVPGCAVYFLVILSFVLHWLEPQRGLESLEIPGIPQSCEAFEMPVPRFDSAATPGRSNIA